ncbi:hypothetical protein MMC18_001591 [Xylographa bjoerkii]|nr:hypothetical protein [Xylographa bjoerkii]
MSDLLSSLVIPKRSQDSFHSASSQPAIHPSPPSPPSQPATQQTLPTSHGAPLVLHDVHAFLSSPETVSLLSSAPSTRPRGALVPVQLGGPHSSASVSRFYELCQEKGLTPVFAIEEDAARPEWFTGTLTVDGATPLVLDARQPSKKEARQLLAERGCALVRGLPARVQRKDASNPPAAAAENWVGKLLEFSALAPALPAPTFTDYALGAAFACECRIAQRPAAPFGGTDVLFGSKKAAKTHAAREAVQFLIQSGELEADGSVRKKRKKVGAGAVRAEEEEEEKKKRGEQDGERSWGERVVDLCTALGLTPPTYRFAPNDPATAPNILSGAAHFANEPLMRAPVGEVRNVYGRKNAREECARGVVAFLEGLRRERLGE